MVVVAARRRLVGLLSLWFRQELGSVETSALVGAVHLGVLCAWPLGAYGLHWQDCASSVCMSVRLNTPHLSGREHITWRDPRPIDDHATRAADSEAAPASGSLMVQGMWRRKRHEPGTVVQLLPHQGSLRAIGCMRVAAVLFLGGGQIPQVSHACHCAVCPPRERAKHGVTAALAWLGAAHSWVLDRTPLTDCCWRCVPNHSTQLQHTGNGFPPHTPTRMFQVGRACAVPPFCNGKHTLVWCWGL